ncbi:MAG: thiosulfate sulfurtransferase [Halioglobus sp.]|jgi:thiosulfate sulfurtransferase
MSFKRISIEEAKELIDKGDVTLVDVRDAGAYQAAHVDNAINVSDANVEEFVSTVSRDIPLIVFCYHGNMSQGAADHFATKGIPDVYSVDGGFEAWRLKY